MPCAWAWFSVGTSPRRVEERLLDSVDTRTRYPPSVVVEEVDDENVVMRINATPLRPADGSQLAEEVLTAFHPGSTGRRR